MLLTASTAMTAIIEIAAIRFQNVIALNIVVCKITELAGNRVSPNQGIFYIR